MEVTDSFKPSNVWYQINNDCESLITRLSERMSVTILNNPYWQFAPTPPKKKAMVEVINTEKHFSLLWYEINNGRKSLKPRVCEWRAYLDPKLAPSCQPPID